MLRVRRRRVSPSGPHEGTQPGDAEPGGPDEHRGHRLADTGIDEGGQQGARPELAEPEREVVVAIGDGTYLMLNSEIVTAVAEGSLARVGERLYVSINDYSQRLGMLAAVTTLILASRFQSFGGLGACAVAARSSVRQCCNNRAAAWHPSARATGARRGAPAGGSGRGDADVGPVR